jgi:HEPN domain-containing protein
MADPGIVKEWLGKADEDLRFANFILKERDEFLPQVCFHFQQSAEKYLKAFVIAHNLDFRKIHNLPELLRVCAAKDETLLPLKEECEFLTDFYIEARYPVHWPSDISSKEAKRAQEAAERIRNEIKKRLGGA